MSESHVELSEVITVILHCLFNPFRTSEHAHEYCEPGRVFSEDLTEEGGLTANVCHTMNVAPRLNKTGENISSSPNPVCGQNQLFQDPSAMLSRP